MSFFKIFSPSKSRKRKPQRKTPPKAKAQARIQPSNNQNRQSQRHYLPSHRDGTDYLSERKLDLTGIILAVVGIRFCSHFCFLAARVFTSGPDSLSCSDLRLGGSTSCLLRLFFFGVWLILRRNERLPAFSLERATGIVFLFFWLLAFMHIIYVPLNLASDAADHGVARLYWQLF